MRGSKPNIFVTALLFCVCFGFLGAVIHLCPASTPSPARPHEIQANIRNGSLRAIPGEKRVAVAQDHGRPPSSLIADQRQANGEATFDEVGLDSIAFLTHKRVVSNLQETEARVDRMRKETANPKGIRGSPPVEKISEGHASHLRVRILGINKDQEVAPEDSQPVKVNYFFGNVPPKRHTNIPTCKTALYRSTPTGIDIKFYGNDRHFECGVIIKAGAALSKASVQCCEAEDVHVTKTGGLRDYCFSLHIPSTERRWTGSPGNLPRTGDLDSRNDPG